MALQIDTAAHACNQIAREVREYQKNLSIHFIVHHGGQRTEALALAAQEILPHPAAETAMHFLQKPRKSEESALLGTAVARQNIFFGLTTRDSILALCTMNLDHFASLKDAKRQAYHLAWHALDAVEYHSDPRNRKGGAREVIIRRRNALELAGANLQADVFSAAMSAFTRDKEATRRIALARGKAALHTRSLFSPEFFPFVIGMEATEFALGQTDPDHMSKKRKIPNALKIARQVSKTYDEISMKHWLAFAEPAQDMAWRGFSEEEILSAAINTSQNTYIRAIGYLIAELGAIEPTSIVKIRENYSPFADNEFNETLHEKIVDQIFQDVIAQGLKQNSAVPFITMANQQNAALTEGKTIGWCASALQAAGVAYDTARREGNLSEHHVRQEFQSKRYAVPWDDLKTLGKRIIRQQRSGEAVTMKDIQNIGGDINSIKTLQQSVGKTMQEPAYKQKLDAANELAANLGQRLPKAEAELAAAPAAPAPVHNFSIPGLGGATKRGTIPAQTTRQKEKAAEDTGESAGHNE